MFNKDPELSLIDAIKKQILSGYSETDCIVTMYTNSPEPLENPSYQTAWIDIPHTATTRMQLDALAAKCPPYTKVFGTSYFMMDPQHPNKMLFIKDGQDNIPSGVGGLTWDGTIKVLQ